MPTSTDKPRSLPPSFSRWSIYLALWLLLSSVFASQLFLAGYVRPWSRAFAAEAVYWLSWGILLPVVFWWCRQLRSRTPGIRIAGLLFGALAATLLVPLLSQSFVAAQAALQVCIGPCDPGVTPLSRDWLIHAVRVAGINLPVYAGFVLAWHAASYYRESRDRQVRATQLESMLHQAQLEALRSQLNPHFLFNTLHSIAELVHANPKLAEQIIVRLGELLRRVLQSSTQAEATLADELDFIRSYVEIEQLRLGERLNVNWDIDPELAQARVPSLVLQPLVENAIQHGIAASAAPGTLTVRAQRDAGRLLLEVHDTGPGMQRKEAGSAHGIGLANTRARLERLYGAHHGFELGNDHGMSVRLRIPLDVA